MYCICTYFTVDNTVRTIVIFKMNYNINHGKNHRDILFPGCSNESMLSHLRKTYIIVGYCIKMYHTFVLFNKSYIELNTGTSSQPFECYQTNPTAPLDDSSDVTWSLVGECPEEASQEFKYMTTPCKIDCRKDGICWKKHFGNNRQSHVVGSVIGLYTYRYIIIIIQLRVRFRTTFVAISM